jgi:ABC-2 type transport system ATP-binding protein
MGPPTRPAIVVEPTIPPNRRSNDVRTHLLARNSPTIRAAADNATDTARLIELVAAAGYPSTRVNGAIEIVAPARWAADLNRLAWHAGITLGELQATSVDLGQAFFAMTGDTREGTN